uniref:TIR domain-containing protein n=1 Tax=Macrostomum lignano TaxID=282301 RepID=A0A1I8H2J0_9PLAT
MLRQVSQIQVDSPSRVQQAEMQLCLGDITKIEPGGEPYDVIMISAFSADYSAVPSTVIGALKRQFNLSVVANRERSPEKAVGEIFRAMFTVFADNMSVISPLLATGCQRASKSRIMHALVTAWHTWISIGLPMRRYTLVIYTSKLAVESLAEDDRRAVQEFQRLKHAFESRHRKPDPVPIEADLLVVCSEKDLQFLERTTRSLKANQKSLRCRKVVHSDDSSSSSSGDEAAEGSKAAAATSAIDARRSDMLGSRLVVCLLSQAFLATRACVEDFNVAMCLAHTRWHPFLPVCLERLASPPTYMSLIQWIDCRPKPTDQPGCDKLQAAIGEIGGRLEQLALGVSKQAEPALGPAAVAGGGSGYDIFISYCHRNSAAVEPFLTHLRLACPALRIFFDKQGIQTGYSWMETIYSAISGSRLIVAFLTPDYAKSAVCLEEFTIASMLHRCDRHQALLLPVCLERLGPACPPALQSVARWLDATGSREQCVKRVAVSVAKVLTAKSGDKKAAHLREQLFPDCHELSTLMSQTDKLRQSLLNAKPPLLSSASLGAFVKAAAAAAAERPLPVVDICHAALVCHPDEREPLVEAVRLQAKEFATDLQVRCLDSEQAHDDMEAMEQASVVALFLSPVFLTSARLTSLLYLALCRRRSRSAPVLLFCLNPLPRHPAFLSLLPVNASMEDVKTLAFMYNGQQKELSACLGPASRQQFYKLTHAESVFAVCCARAIVERLLGLPESLVTTPAVLVSLSELAAGAYLRDPNEPKPWKQVMEPI